MLLLLPVPVPVLVGPQGWSVWGQADRGVEGGDGEGWGGAVYALGCTGGVWSRGGCQWH